MIDIPTRSDIVHSLLLKTKIIELHLAIIAEKKNQNVLHFIWCND